jgi:hypothetical protein
LTRFFTYAASKDTLTQYSDSTKSTVQNTWVIESFSNVKKEAAWSRGRKFRFNIVATKFGLRGSVSLRLNSPDGAETKQAWLDAFEADNIHEDSERDRRSPSVIRTEEVGEEAGGGAVVYASDGAGGSTTKATEDDEGDGEAPGLATTTPLELRANIATESNGYASDGPITPNELELVLDAMQTQGVLGLSSGSDPADIVPAGGNDAVASPRSPSRKIVRRRSHKSSTSRSNIVRGIDLPGGACICDYSNQPQSECGCQEAHIVDLQYKIITVRDFDMAKSTYRCSFELYAWWKDDRTVCEIKHIDSQRHLIAQPAASIAEQIEAAYLQGWNPDLQVTNACDSTSSPLLSRKRILDIKLVDEQKQKDEESAVEPFKQQLTTASGRGFFSSESADLLLCAGLEFDDLDKLDCHDWQSIGLQLGDLIRVKEWHKQAKADRMQTAFEEQQRAKNISSLVKWSMLFDCVLFRKFDFKMFPFDAHNLKIVVAPNKLGHDSVVLSLVEGHQRLKSLQQSLFPQASLFLPNFLHVGGTHSFHLSEQLMSTTEKRRSMMQVHLVVQRNWVAYVQNEALVFFLLGSLGFVVFAQPSNEIGDRLDVLVTLLLGLIAQKFTTSRFACTCIFLVCNLMVQPDV